MLVELRLVERGELVQRHRGRVMGGGREARSDHPVHFVMTDLAIVIDIEFAQEPVGQATVAVHKSLHRSVRRLRSLHLRQGKACASDRGHNPKKQGDLQSRFHERLSIKSAPAN